MREEIVDFDMIVQAKFQNKNFLKRKNTFDSFMSPMLNGDYTDDDIFSSLGKSGCYVISTLNKYYKIN